MKHYIAASRGRDAKNPSHRGKANENYRQVLEINRSGMANALTQIAKDNYVLEKRDKETR